MLWKPVLLPGKSHGRRSLVGCSPWGSQRVGHDWVTSLSLFTFHFHALEKEMATHSSVLAWRIPGTGEPGGLPSRVTQSRTRLKRLSSSSSSEFKHIFLKFFICTSIWLDLIDKVFILFIMHFLISGNILGTCHKPNWFTLPLLKAFLKWESRPGPQW